MNTLYLMRGAPGSGKSTAAQIMRGEGIVCISTDDFWGDSPEEYKKNFNKDLLGVAHKCTQYAAKKLMQAGVNAIVVDNTNMALWEMKPYVELAEAYNYDVKFVEATSPAHKHAMNVLKDFKEVCKQLSDLSKHDVPPEIVGQMLLRYEENPTVEKVLASISPF